MKVRTSELPVRRGRRRMASVVRLGKPGGGVATAGLRVAVIAALALAWIVASQVSQLIPGLGTTVRLLYSGLFTSGDFRAPLAFSMQPILEGFGIATVSGVAIGLWLGRSEFWRAVFEPPLNGMFAVPRIIVYPVLLAAFGVTITSETWLAVISSFFPVAITTVAGTRAISPVLIKLGDSLSCSTWTALRKIYVPAALPGIMVGVRLGFSGAFVTVTGAEIYASRGGLGQTLNLAYQLDDYARMFAVVLLLTLIALAGNLALVAVERRVKFAAG